MTGKIISTRRLTTLALLLTPTLALASTNEGSFTPISVKVPIRALALENSTTNQGTQVYSCAGDTEAACLVDIADSTALAALSTDASASISSGEYDRISVGTCKDEGGYSVQIKGQVSLGGTTYYTAANPVAGNDPLTTVPESNDYTRVSFTGCAARFQLPTTLTINPGDSIKVSLISSLKNIAWAKLAGNTIPSGCVENTGQNKSVCMAYPDLVPYVGDVTPSLEEYRITEDVNDNAGDKAGGQVLLVLDASDNILGGYTRRFFSQTSQSLSANFDTPVRTATVNTGGTTYTVANYGSSATTSYLTFTEFLRSNHTATYRVESSGSSVEYRAVKQ
jgi:hypothetical protein